MSKGRARAAQARLPTMSMPLATEPARPVADVAAAAWPEPAVLPGDALWLCACFSVGTVFTERLYLLAYRYTPVLSGEAECLFMEVAGSLKLYGGLQPMRESLLADLQAAGESVVLACAPTPRAARWLAMAGQSVACVDNVMLRQAVAALPLAASGWPDKVQRKLGQMGLRTLGCCLRLPRDGFARRVGKEYLQQLDEALGIRPQLLRPYELPLRFYRRVELDEETTDHNVLLAAVQKPLTRLGRFLRRRQAAVQSFNLRLIHRNAGNCAHTPLQILAGRPCTDTGLFTDLTALQFERLILPAPVIALELSARGEPVSRSETLVLPGIEPGSDAASSNLADSAQWSELQARLQARLGAARVYRLGTVAEHRPEQAWQIAEARPDYRAAGDSASFATPASGLQRPLWLLAKPQRISQPAGEFCSRMAERIESGWWDGDDMRRDYYRVSRSAGSDWWVYQDCRSRAWYLHGLFG